MRRQPGLARGSAPSRHEQGAAIAFQRTIAPAIDDRQADARPGRDPRRLQLRSHAARSHAGRGAPAGEGQDRLVDRLDAFDQPCRRIGVRIGVVQPIHVGQQHDEVARALEAHATAVEESLALIAEIERRVHAATAAARGRVHRFLDGLLDSLDPVDDALARFVPPPPGSPDWLHVRLPGLSLPGFGR